MPTPNTMPGRTSSSAVRIIGSTVLRTIIVPWAAEVEPGPRGRVPFLEIRIVERGVLSWSALDAVGSRSALDPLVHELGNLLALTMGQAEHLLLDGRSPDE